MTLGTAERAVDVPTARASAIEHRPRGFGAGLALCLASAVAFGLAALFAKHVYATGMGVSSMLVWRFTLAALALWVIVAFRRPARLPRRALVTTIGLGAVGYALQAAFYFTALTRMDASMVGLVLYVYPTLVVVLALVLRHESPHRRKTVALVCSIAGLALLLGAGGPGSTSALGVTLALGAAVTYALYITVLGRLPGGIDVYLVAAIVCTAAAVSIAAFTVTTGTFELPASGAAWIWILLVALVPTVVGVACFFAGLRRVGASTAAITSCVEPVVTAISAVIVYGERLTIGQLAGGAAVLGAVVVLSTRGRQASHRGVVSG